MKFCLVLWCFLVGAATRLPLLRLKAYWVGNGVSYFVPGRLQLLSAKLKQQSGLMTGHLPLPAGREWQLGVTLQLDCRSSAEAALGLFLTARPSLQYNSDYTADNRRASFGMAPDIAGLGVLFHRGNVHAGYYNETISDRGQFLRKAQVTKAVFDPATRELRLRLKRWGSSVSVYQVDAKTGAESSCGSFEDAHGLTSFYLSVSAYDAGGACHARLSAAELETQTPVELVPEANKTRADSQFALHAEEAVAPNDLGHFFRVNALNKQNAKIIARELLEFADKDEKAVASDLAADYNDFAARVGDTVAVVEKEARQISALAAALEQQQGAQTAGKEASLAQLLAQLEALERNFRAVDEYTASIHRGIKGFELFEHVEEVNYQVESAVDELKMLLSRTKKVIDQARKARGSGAGLDTLKQRLDNFAQTVGIDLERHSRRRSSTFWRLFGLLVGTLVLLVVLVYGFLYLKLHRASQFKRLL